MKELTKTYPLVERTSILIGRPLKAFQLLLYQLLLFVFPVYLEQANHNVLSLLLSLSLSLSLFLSNE